MQMQWQVVVRDADEAVAAVRAGAERLEIATAALEVIRAAVQRVRYLRDDVVIVAGPGAVGAGSDPAVALRVRQVTDCGVDLVSVAVPAGSAGDLLLTRLGGRVREGLPVMPEIAVPVGLAAVSGDHAGRLAHQVAVAAAQHFPAVLLDLTDPASGHADALWTEPVEPGGLVGAIMTLRRSGAKVGLRAAPRPCDVAQLLRWSPDFVGLTCQERGEREPLVLDAARVTQWQASLAARQAGGAAAGVGR
jgi:hypothetical protein